MFGFGRQSLRKFWVKLYERNRADLEAAASNDYPATAPEESLHAVGEQQLGRAIEILAGGGDAGLAEAHARRFDDPSDPNDNNEQTRYYWIDSIDASLLGGDVERAGRLLEAVPRPIRYHKRQFELLGELIALAGGEMSEGRRAGFVDEFDEFYDRIRDARKVAPGSGSLSFPIQPLEVGLLRYAYIDHPGQEIDWSAAIEQFAR